MIKWNSLKIFKACWPGFMECYPERMVHTFMYILRTTVSILALWLNLMDFKVLFKIFYKTGNFIWLYKYANYNLGEKFR